MESPTIWSQVNSLFHLKSPHKSHFYLPLFDAVSSKPLEPFDLLYVLSYTSIVSVIPGHFVWKASEWSRYYSDFYYYQGLPLVENLIWAALGLNSQPLRLGWEECCRSRAAKVLKHTHQSRLLCAELYNTQDWPLKSINLNQYFSSRLPPLLLHLSVVTVVTIPLFVIFLLPLLSFLSQNFPRLSFLFCHYAPRGSFICRAVSSLGFYALQEMESIPTRWVYAVRSKYRFNWKSPEKCEVITLVWIFKVIAWRRIMHRQLFGVALTGRCW